MSLSRTTMLAIGTVIGFTIGASGLAIAFSELGMPAYMRGSNAVAALRDNEGVYVDKTSFQLRIGDAKAPGEVMGEITKLGGKEVANGAIIVRSGDKLYLIDGKPTH